MTISDMPGLSLAARAAMGLGHNLSPSSGVSLEIEVDGQRYTADARASVCYEGHRGSGAVVLSLRTSLLSPSDSSPEQPTVNLWSHEDSETQRAVRNINSWFDALGGHKFNLELTVNEVQRPLQVVGARAYARGNHLVLSLAAQD